MADERSLLARGPWDPDRLEVSWRGDAFQPDAAAAAAADDALQELRDRGSPSHDGLAAGLVAWESDGDRLRLELQPVRWSLRLLPENAVGISCSCMVRAADGRWLAGRRAAWLASWAGRWALGAAGAVEVDENPAATMHRELQEEWSVQAERLQLEALVRLPSGSVLLIGQAWLAEGATVTPDDEHDEYAWWPPDVAAWPPEAHAPLRIMAGLASA
ncbi:MAG TPA: NUDIX hydrolase [Solirubrobacteraceae bacterium]|nr:NUDIX hydrolase [Solirubrobacteraceae bacterium]